MKNNPTSAKAVTKKPRRLSLAFLSVGLLFCSTLFSHTLRAQGIVEGPVMLTGDLETSCIIGGISANGRYIFGMNPEASFCYDRETKKSFYSSQNHKIVSVFDNGDMLVFVTGGNGGITTGTNHKFTPFTSPDSEYPFVGPLYATPDGKYVCGNVAKEAGGFTLRPFVGIRQEDGSYKLSILEILEKDVLGLEAQFTNAMFCSEDGKQVFGLQKDWTGRLDRFIVWEMDKEGKYHIRGLDDSTFFGETIPLPNDFEFTVIPTSGRKMLPSSNGNYVCAGTRPYKKDDEQLGQESPYIYNLTEKKSVIFDKILDAIAINAWSNRELLFAKVAETGGYDSYAGRLDGTQMHLTEWIKQKTGVSVEDFYQTERGTPVVGLPFFSKDGKVLVTFRIDPTNPLKGNIAYMVFKDGIFTGTGSPDLSQSLQKGYEYDATNRKIRVMANAQVSLFDIPGSLLAHSTVQAGTDWQLPGALPEGIYVLRITINGQHDTIKVAL